MTSSYLTDGAKTAENNHFNLLMYALPVTLVLFILKEQCTLKKKRKIPSCHSHMILFLFCGTMKAYTGEKLHKHHKAVRMTCHTIASRDKENSHLASCDFRAAVKGNKQT